MDRDREIMSCDGRRMKKKKKSPDLLYKSDGTLGTENQGFLNSEIIILFFSQNLVSSPKKQNRTFKNKTGEVIIVLRLN